MRLIVLFCSSFLLNGCFLFMHKCDSLSGWCSSKGKGGLEEYQLWRTQKELKNLEDNFTLTLGIKEREEEDNKKKSILSKCQINPYTGKLQEGTYRENAYDCANKNGIYKR